MATKKDDRLWAQEAPDRLTINFHGKGKIVGRIWLDACGKLRFSGDLDETCRNLFRALERMIDLYPLNVGRVLGAQKGKGENFKM